MTARELRLRLPSLELAARDWGPGDGARVLALHGWLDNAASFDGLAPLLDRVRVVAIDLPGHGRSDRLPPGCGMHFADWVAIVLAVADALEWPRFAVIGHSMGAGIASLLPGVAPERIERVVLLEGIGPLSEPAERAPATLAEALAQEARLAESAPRLFPSFEAAVAARRRDSDLDPESASRLVERGSERVEGGVRFSFDPRLRTRSRVRFTEEQVHAFLRAIACPALALRALQGWPFPEELVAARAAAIPGLQVVEVEGGHHVHLTHPERVATAVREFLAGEGPGASG
jgi:pimeloyl-ACP methyl ester carboxylesterase